MSVAKTLANRVNQAKVIYDRVLESPWDGMTDEELEICASLPNERLVSPQLYWTSEIYSLGRWLRKYAYYPNFLPLFVTSDHGVNLHSRHFNNEEKRQSKVHLSWNPQMGTLSSKYEKSIVYVRHPYLECIKKKNINLAKNRKGVLIFYSHHLPGFEMIKDVDSYFDQLANLSADNRPLVISLHMHDIKAGNHLKLRKYGLPLVTAGDTSSVYFAERLLKLISKFGYTTSPGWGSHVAYSIKLGVPFFFLGPKPKYINVSHEKHPKGELNFSDDHHIRTREKAEIIFAKQQQLVNEEQRRFIDCHLGVDSRRNRYEVAMILWTQLFMNCNLWPKEIIKPYLRKAKHKVLKLIKS